MMNIEGLDKAAQDWIEGRFHKKQMADYELDYREVMKRISAKGVMHWDVPQIIADIRAGK